jgi:hypothetical protein
MQQLLQPLLHASAKQRDYCREEEREAEGLHAPQRGRRRGLPANAKIQNVKYPSIDL